ncbi:hypothetical protein NUACC26_087530 [Scytonema sp. NUACC26]
MHYKAQNEISSKAWLLLRTLNSVRSYTSVEVTPQIEPHLGADDFSPQVIPAYSAKKVFEQLSKENKSYSNFLYKEAMLNPTNVHDKADNFEAPIVQKFRKNRNLQQETGFRSLGNEQYFYIARPLEVTSSSCLRCHIAILNEL